MRCLSIIFPVLFLLTFSLFSFAEIITLKTGKTVEGEILERTEEYLKIDFYGVHLKYYFDEIKSIDDDIQTLPPITEKIVSPSPPALSLSPQPAEKSGEEKKKEPSHESVPAPQPPQEIILHFKKGKEHIKHKRYEKAVKELQKAIKENPYHSKAYNELGFAYYSLEMYRPAIVYYRRAIEVDSDFAQAHNNLGVAYKAVKDYRRASSHFQKAIEIDPEYADAYYNLGFAQYILGKHQQAITFCQKAVELDSNHAEGFAGLGFIYYFLGKPEQARQNLRKAKKLFESLNEDKDASLVNEYLAKLP